MKKIVILSSLILNLILITIILSSINQISTDKKSSVSKFPFLSKRIFIENQNDLLINFIPLRFAMREYVAKQKEQISVYFEYLPTGNSIGVNDQIETRFASLVKVPVIMAIYKQIELGKLKKDQLLIVKNADLDKNFGDLWKKGPGYKISVQDAIGLALKKSDNTAARVLTSALPQGAIDDIFQNLDIPIDKKDNLPIISAKNYTSILRSLYLSSYLDKNHSNEILSLLSETDFNYGIPKGTDSNIVVSHKIGVYVSEGIFSDCGIIYLQNRPYSLCIIVKGNQNRAIENIVLLSKMVYGYLIRVSP